MCVKLQQHSRQCGRPHSLHPCQNITPSHGPQNNHYRPNKAWEVTKDRRSSCLSQQSELPNISGSMRPAELPCNTRIFSRNFQTNRPAQQQQLMTDVVDRLGRIFLAKLNESFFYNIQPENKRLLGCSYLIVLPFSTGYRQSESLSEQHTGI